MLYVALLLWCAAYNDKCPADKSPDSLPNGYSSVTWEIASTHDRMPSKQAVAGSSPVSRSNCLLKHLY